MGKVSQRHRGFCYDKDKYSKIRLIEFIESRRRTLKIKRAELAEELGMSASNLGYMLDPEKGNAKFSYIHIVKILQKLEATDEEILQLMKQ